MRVLHVIPAVSPKYGGPSEALVPMCKALSKRGVDVQIASTDAEPRGRIRVELATPTAYQDVPVIFFKRQWSEAFKYSPQLAGWLNRNVSRFDLVHIHGVFSHACFSAATACRRSGIPYVIRPLGNLEDRSLKQKSLRKKLFLNLGGNRMLRNAAAIHYVCETEKRRSETAIGINHGIVVPLGIDLSPPSLTKERNISDQRPYLLVLSRLQPSKGIDVLIEAFLAAREDKPLSKWQLVIAGKGSSQYEALLKRKIKARGATDTVLFPGWLEGEAKARRLNQASLLALPSHHDAFGFCLVEAMSYGVPVIASPEVGLASEIAADRAGWITAVETKSLTDTLRSAMSDESERRMRGAAGRQLVRKFDWDEVTDHLIRLYELAIRGVTV